MCRMSQSNLKDRFRLYKASLNGDVGALEDMVRQDELIFDRVISLTRFDETPLHISAMHGHLEFTRAFLCRKLELADMRDSVGRLPLHLACAEGHLDIVRELLRSRPGSWSAEDKDGRIPLHMAVMKGRIQVIMELAGINLKSVTKRLGDGGTILHLCIKHNQLEALKLLVHVGDDDFVNSSDENGNTILHLSAIHKQVETTKYLLTLPNIQSNKDALNNKKLTALDAIESKGAGDVEKILQEGGVQRHSKMVWKANRFLNKYFKNVGKGLKQARGNILVAATVTATLTFQAGIAPPSKKNDDKNSSDYEELFWTYNSLATLLSLSVILLMLTGIPLKNKLVTSFLVAIMMLTVVFIDAAYYSASRLHERSNQGGIVLLLKTLFGIIVIFHVLSFLVYLFWKLCSVIHKIRFCYLRNR